MKFSTFAGVSLTVLGLAAAAFFAGPRTPVDTRVSFDATAIGADPAAWLEKQEAGIGGIREGLEKEIIWAFPQSRAKTPLAIVYVHGFSASKGEVRPVPDKLAASLGANLYYTRLAGHGQNGQAMLAGSVNGWVNDLAEALAIGRLIGERVIVIGTSTGGSLAVWGAAQKGMMDNVAGMMLISPNFAVQAQGSEILTLPWASKLVPIIAGDERSFEPANEAHGRLWTTRYPSLAVLPMAEMTKLARDTNVANIKIPALFVFSDADKVVRPDLTRQKAGQWGAKADMMVITASDDPYMHVIAGDALSPSTTEAVAAKALEWVKGL
ncbi:MAG: alpha/beta fold hydrolase [Rhizobiaceae bacterium]